MKNSAISTSRWLPNVTLSDVNAAYGEELLTMTDAIKKVFEKAGLPVSADAFWWLIKAVAEHDRGDRKAGDRGR